MNRIISDYLYLSKRIYPSICLSVVVTMYPHLSIYLSIHPHKSTYHSVCPSFPTHLSIYPSHAYTYAFVHVYLSINLYI